MGLSPASQSKSVGDDLAAVLPQDVGPWYKRSHLVHLNFCIFSLIMFSSSNGFDGSLMNGLQSLGTWQDFMDHPTGSWLGLINAIYWLGNMLCSIPAASISNKWGRKVGVYIGYVFLVLGVALQTAANNTTTFILARLFLGAASTWFGISVPLLINELAYPTQRGVASALFNCGWYVGGTLAAWITFATRDYSSSWGWRLPSLFQLLLPLISLPGFILVSESPRWLINSGRLEEAKTVLAKYHSGGDVDTPLIRYEVNEIETTLKLERDAQNSASYLDMIKTKGNRHRLFISISLGIFAQWSGNGVVSYYLTLVLNTVGIKSATHQLIIAAGLQMWNLIFAVGAALSVDNLGRRKLFLASAITMSISFIIITGLSGSFAESQKASTGAAVIPFLFIFFAGYDIALTPLLVGYPCEIWQYQLRSRGLTVTWISTVLAIFFNVFINPIALEQIGWKFYIVFIVVVVLFGVTAYFFYPETRGHSLEQMAVLFDGDDSLVSYSAESEQVSVEVGAPVKDNGEGVTILEKN